MRASEPGVQHEMLAKADDINPALPRIRNIPYFP